MADQPKAIISTSVVGALGWHIWTILSVSGTGILLYLNFSQFSIGGELGASASSSANVLGCLQIIVKLHELVIVASLVGIAEQCILRDLLGDGLLLGILGAEGALANPSFLVTTRFRLALKFGFGGIYPHPWRKDNQNRLRTLRLVLLIFSCCIIAGLAGPSSAVLMIPRVGWFLDGTQYYPPVGRSTLPTIMISASPDLLIGNKFTESNVFALPDPLVSSGIRYWNDVARYSLQSRSTLRLQDMSMHEFLDISGQVYVNTTGPLERSLDGNRTGCTRITTALKNNDDYHFGSVADDIRTKMNRNWTNIKFVSITNGFDASVTCRTRQKIPCIAGRTPTKNATLDGNSSYPNWCYKSVDANNSISSLQMGRNLLMAKDFMSGDGSPRVWLTEGPRIEENQHYSDSIQVLFEKNPDDEVSHIPKLTVCSFSAMLVAAVSTSYGTEAISQQVEYLDYVLSADGTPAPPRKFLFHENWLDRAYSYDPELSVSPPLLSTAYRNATPVTDGGPFEWSNYLYRNSSSVNPDNFTYPERPGLSPQMNSFGKLGASMISAIYPPLWRSDMPSKAFPVEVFVGGPLTYLLSWTLASNSQYSMSYDQIPERFRLGPPEGLGHTFVYEVYVQGYGFQLSSRTGFLGVGVLLAHAVLALASSLWQFFWRRGIIRAWSTVPDYVCLGAGSASLAVTHPHTCAGIAGEQGLSSLVKIGETGNHGPAAHLEIIDVHGAWTAETSAVDLGNEKKRYGFIAPQLNMD
ncbi:hypothetical protein Q9L58_005884 [Maublancomyces gigas]|uniref:Uncharacterized protein n=1 Tax=Discina gigas TaxID=1032678 RepID=A0ABR3GGS8_9PEZI